MSKLTREQKEEIYHKRKTGVTIKKLEKEYRIKEGKIRYLIRLMDQHGEGILRKDKNRKYSPKMKEEMINKVIIHHQSIISTAIEYGLSSDGLLNHWIKSYRENGYVIVEKTRGRQPAMTKKTNLVKDYQEMSPEEKVKYLENKNLYLEAEVDYLKKLRAVVQARKDQRLKKK